MFTTQYNPLGPNINSVIKKNLPIVTESPNLVEMFPKFSMFCAYKRFSNLKDLIVRADLYIIKPLKEKDQNSGSSGCMKRYDSCKIFVDHVSSFEYIATKKLSHVHHTILYNILSIAYSTKCGKQGAGSTEN